MKRLILLLLTLSLFITTFAQVLKERRVYYLDCSYSMVQNKIWDDVRDNLKKAIDNVSDETTELLVIPFANNTSTKPVLKVYSAYATERGKESLKKQIDNLPMSKSTMTYHYVAVEDFYNKRVDNKRVNYLFLMTDGLDEDPQKRTEKQLLPQWQNRFGNSNVYGFYVMLHDSAKNPVIDKVVNSQEHLWKVETADVNINLLRLQSNAIFNAKNDKYIDLPIYGQASKMVFDASFTNNCPYCVKKVERIGASLRVWIDTKSAQLPVSANYPLNIKMKGGGKYDFLVTDKISVKCENKPERSLKIHVR